MKKLEKLSIDSSFATIVKLPSTRVVMEGSFKIKSLLKDGIVVDVSI